MRRARNNPIQNEFSRVRTQVFLSEPENNLTVPGFNFLDTSAESVTEEMILQYLASIICDIYLKSHAQSGKE